MSSSGGSETWIHISDNDQQDVHFFSIINSN
jgi:hypothetical protein